MSGCSFTLGMYGEGDFYTMKGVVEEFPGQDRHEEKETYDPKSRQNRSCIRADRLTSFMTEPSSAILGEIHPTVADTYGIGERAYVAVLDMPEILPYASFDRKYEGIASIRL